LVTEEGRVVNVDGVDVVVGTTRDNSDGSWAWSCRWCAVTGSADSRDAAYQRLCDHADEHHDADVVIAWREGHPTPVLLDACPQALRAWTAAMLKRYPDSILFVTLFGPRLTGVGEASSWGIQVDLRPSAPDGLDGQIRDDPNLAVAAPPEGVSLWFDRDWSRDRWPRLRAGWQRIAGWPHGGSSMGQVSIQAPDDAYQWHCNLCGARGVVEIGSDETRSESPRHHEAARESAQRAQADQLAHMRAHG
jgi:hypothetical protein